MMAHPDIVRSLAAERERELHQAARLYRIDGRPSGGAGRLPPTRVAEEAIVIREAAPADAPALVRLAELDSKPLPSGPLLVAEVAGEIEAALCLAGGAAMADPFRPTADLVSLLKLRAKQMHRSPTPQPRRSPCPTPLT